MQSFRNENLSIEYVELWITEIFEEKSLSIN
jgi:hypothetical protein